MAGHDSDKHKDVIKAGFVILPDLVFRRQGKGVFVEVLKILIERTDEKWFDRSDQEVSGPSYMCLVRPRKGPQNLVQR